MNKPFVRNSHGRIVFPFNFLPDLDFTVFGTLEQFSAVIKRDFEEKAPTEADVVARLRDGKYAGRYELLRDLALDLFWVNRYALTMYEKRPMRWGDVPRHREDVFLPVYKHWDVAGLAAAIEAGYYALPPTWDAATEDKAFRILLDVFRNKPGAGSELPAIKPTVKQILMDPGCLTLHLRDYDPDFPRFSYQEIIDYTHPVAELEALTRQAMVFHNHSPWNREKSVLTPLGQLRADDIVVPFFPKNNDVFQFIHRVKRGARTRPARPKALDLSRPIQPYPPVEVRKRFQILPRVEAIAVYEGEVACTNEDLIRNTAWCWSRMTAAEIGEKTGIQQRLYSELDLEHMALLAARAALDKSGRRPAEIGAILFCTCTSSKLIPSIATWLSGELGLYQTHASCDMVAACAGMPYGLAEGVRQLQEVERPVLVVCAEKFSDKIGTVRTSRMIFGDGAAAVVLAPVPAGTATDIEVFQTYASGPWAEVNSIIWPNPEFDNNITVYGPEVKALVKRYLTQMMGELKALPHPDGTGGTLLDAIDLVVPHQANKNMVVNLAQAAGIPPERLYFNIDRVGNTSAASILLAIRDAVRQGRIDRPMRVFAPGFGAGAVGGYVVMRVDPAVVA
jgi:3-oxoacyl-[acyl-carrier-protein] synthase III